MSFPRSPHASRRPAPQPQAPLPPFPPPDPPDCPDCKIHTVLTQPVPKGYDPRWLRMNAWAVTVPGLPWVPGGSSEHPERCLTGFFNRWSADWQQKILVAHAERNLSHFQLWTGDALSGTYGAQPQSLADYAAQTRRIKDMGFYVDHALMSKITDPHDGTWETHRDHVLAIRDALVAANAIDATDGVDVGWELDLWNIPGEPLQTIIDGVCEAFAAIGCRVYVHFSPWKQSWQTDGTSWEDWWRIQFAKPHPITGIKWQADPNASIPLMQSRFNSMQRLFAALGPVPGRGHYFDPVPFELVAENQFTGDAWTEAMGAMFGWCLICTTFSETDPVGPVRPMGGGQGARYPDGMWL